jgi:hypothetical protein
VQICALLLQGPRYRRRGVQLCPSCKINESGISVQNIATKLTAQVEDDLRANRSINTIVEAASVYYQ